MKLHEGALAAEDLADYTAIEKVDWHELNAGAVTAYAVPLALSEGVFALTDGEVKKVTVGGKLTINGGVTLKVDAIGTECDNFEVQSLKERGSGLPTACERLTIPLSNRAQTQFRFVAIIQSPTEFFSDKRLGDRFPAFCTICALPRFFERLSS